MRHADTSSRAHEADPSVVSAASASFDGLVRLVTCVYYVNKDWEPAHAGQLRVYVNAPQSSAGSPYWDIPPKLDTLVVFRSRDVEHEVLPTFHERLALTIWYYGRVSTQPSAQQPQRAVPASTGPPTTHPTPSKAIATGPPALPTLSAGTSASSTIFVAIPSYRDPECRHTVDNLLRQASNPDRVRVGVCLQQSADDGDDDPRAYFAREYAPTQVRVQWIDYREAAGPCVARAEAQKLWDGEAFYLQIDSHTRFRRGWDAFLIAELAKCPSAKPILTTYPLGYTLPNNVRLVHQSVWLFNNHRKRS